MKILGILFILAVLCFIPAEYKRYKKRREYKRFWEENVFRYYLACRQSSRTCYDNLAAERTETVRNIENQITERRKK